MRNLISYSRRIKCQYKSKHAKFQHIHILSQFSPQTFSHESWIYKSSWTSSLSGVTWCLESSLLLVAAAAAPSQWTAKNNKKNKNRNFSSGLIHDLHITNYIVLFYPWQAEGSCILIPSRSSSALTTGHLMLMHLDIYINIFFACCELNIRRNSTLRRPALHWDVHQAEKALLKKTRLCRGKNCPCCRAIAGRASPDAIKTRRIRHVQEGRGWLTDKMERQCRRSSEVSAQTDDTTRPWLRVNHQCWQRLLFSSFFKSATMAKNESPASLQRRKWCSVMLHNNVCSKLDGKKRGTKSRSFESYSPPGLFGHTSPSNQSGQMSAEENEFFLS